MLSPVVSPVIDPVVVYGVTTPIKGGAAQYAPYPAPTGYRWDFVTAFGTRVTAFGEPVVALVHA